MLYPTSLTNNAWNVIEPLFEYFGYRDKGRKHSIRSIVDAIFYIVDNGNKWRSLPNDFPPWKTVYHHFAKWSKERLWESINLNLVELARKAEGRNPTPSLASIDSQSQDAEPGIEGRGLDGNKKRNGRKRHIAVDVLGLILGCMSTPANESDRHAGEILTEQLNDSENFPRIAKILGDNIYDGVGQSCPIPITVESKEREEGQKGFVPEAFRWVVERTFAWLNRQRRLSRNFEKKTCHQESMNFIASIRLCLKKIQKSI